MGRLLHRPAFNFFTRNSPRSTCVKFSKVEDKWRKFSRDLLKVELAGITAASYYLPQNKEQQGEWLRRLANNQTTVTFTLICKRVPLDHSSVDIKNNLGLPSNSLKEELNPQLTTQRISNPEQHQIALAKINYRPGMSFFRKDLGSSLVAFGRAGVASGMHINDSCTRTIHGSEKLDDLKLDAQYMENLGKVEFEAVKASLGMWSDETVRVTRRDLTDEADYEANASTFSKIWRNVSSWRK